MTREPTTYASVNGGYNYNDPRVPRELKKMIATIGGQGQWLLGDNRGLFELLTRDVKVR